MIGIIGGTGPQGKGLAYRLAVAGVDVLIGSRSAERGAQVAEDLSQTVPTGGQIVGAANMDLPERCDRLIVAVPYEGLGDTLAPMTGMMADKVVMSAVNNLGFAGGPHALPVPAGSAAQEIAELLPGARITTAFNNVSATHLVDASHVFDEDVLVCGDDPDAVADTVALTSRVAGLRGVAVGPLRLAATVEAMTAVVIAINKAHKVTAGLRITGL